ncbi:von Willebrand factor type A [Arcobacter nitrofigilis DSM 7299]|uniref:von Willebrand factor type A n=1 Tax=Arcobacter nitrofigilis (strain ATCC 33309 / DSM 7299 / CCUG 15893 / LMG 7604 / NCTC 12251 / CI) TaxID=572480 RepID=D5V2K5_ARCNC|nr:VWA domain-containing protein [Arcobacter nitrofigilis]ADG92437.1 von Willebrand factor type A [Arcobacter nitrofigilis DSM 7299]
MFSNFSFEYPWVLALIFVFIFCDMYCKAKNSSYYFVHLKIFKQLTYNTNIIVYICKYLTIILTLVALASPVKILNNQLLKKDGINIILDLDTSGSMRERGFNPNDLQQNRWNVVNNVVQDFIEKRVNDNIGLVVFGTSVLTASPLSFDKNSQKEIIKYIDIGIVGEQTAMFDSLATSINILKNSKAKSNIIILLTDGEDNASKIPPQIILKLAKKYKIKIYTIGIGESNRQMLSTISQETGAKSFLANSKDDLVEVYNTINKLEKSDIDKNTLILKDYLFFYPLFIGIIFLIFYIYLKNRD